MKYLVLLFTFISIVLITSCDKDECQPSCYDESIVHNGICTTDCPGFEGCDGKMYCNECEAARVGIGPK